MTLTREQSYISACKELNDPPLRQLQETLRYDDAKLDISKIYLPRRHFRCVLQLIVERPDIEELILDGTNIGVEEVRLLKEFLLRSCVSKLSLQQIKLDAASANIIRQLCIENSNLVSLVLRDTYIPSYLVDEIMLIVDWNRLNAESLGATSTAVQQKTSAAARWMLCRGKKDNNFSVTLKPFSSATRKVVDSFVTSYEPVFNDISFQPDTFNHPVAGTETIRWNKYHALHFYQEDELGNFKATFRPSRHYNNRNLCAALNILSFYDSLYKALALKRYPEAGLYVFRLFFSGSPVEVYVDDLVPCVHEGATCTIIGLNSCSSSFYAAILEKAVAKAIGGYRYIQELSLSDCIEILTGCTCFEVNLLNRSSFSTAFDTLRALSEYGYKLVACAIPRTSFEEQTFEESGVCCGIPYAILKTDVCRKNGVHHAFLIQVAAPSRGKALRYAFEYEMYKTEEVNGNFVSWLTVEDFAATFERVFLLLWPFGDAVWDHKTAVEFQVKSKYLSASSQFASNPSFLIQNKGRNSSPVMVSLSASSASDTPIGAQCFFYKAANTENVDTMRLYNVCENNAFFQSGVLEGSEGSLFFNLLPRERLQMTLSSYVPSSVRIQISSVENVDAIQLPETMASSTFSAQWNTLLKAKRFSDDIFQLSRITDGCIATLVLALSQTPSGSPPFPIGVLGWKGTSIDVVNVAKPHFCTQQERLTACVHSFVLTLAAGESLFLLPYCRGSRCPDDYALTVFCNETFAQSRVKAASVLQCTKT